MNLIENKILKQEKLISEIQILSNKLDKELVFARERFLNLSKYKASSNLEEEYNRLFDSHLEELNNILSEIVKYTNKEDGKLITNK